MRNYIKLYFIFILSIASIGVAAQDYGDATYFDDAFHGRRTSSGEIYDKDKLTCAYKKYAFGDILRVTRLDNKRAIEVRIIDKGPFIKGRLIELSKRAAQRLDMLGEESVEVKVELVRRAGEVAGTNIESGEVEEEPITKYEVPEPRITTLPDENVEKPTSSRSRDLAKAETKREKQKMEKEVATTASPKTTANPAASKVKELDEQAIPLRRGNFQNYDLYKVQLLRPQRKGFGVQVAYISNYENVMKEVAKLQEKWFKNILVSVEKGKNNKPVYRIVLGPFPDQETATAYKKRLKRNKKIDGFLVDLSELKY